MDEHTVSRATLDGSAQPGRLGRRAGLRSGVPRLPKRLPVRTALATAVVALALPAVTGGVSSAEPPVAYPDTPRAIGGGDPLKDVPKSVECSRAKDRPGRKDYLPLSSLKQAPADNPFLTRDRGSVAIELQNEKGQRFRIYMSATTPAMLRRFIATSSACFEYFPLAKGPGRMVEPVQFDAALVKAAANNTGRSQTALATLRDGLVAAGGPATLNDVVAQAAGSPVEVIAKASAAASAALDAKVAAGQLSAAEVTALDVPAIMSALATQPKAVFLYPSTDVPSTGSQLSAQVLGDKRGIVVVGAVPVNPPKNEKQLVIWFAFDPTFGIGAGATHHYVAQCRQSSWVGVYSLSGSEQLKFWRQSPYYLYLGAKTASALNKYVQLSHSSTPVWRGYDTSVYGVAAGTYSIYGGYTWYRGSGGGCG